MSALHKRATALLLRTKGFGSGDCAHEIEIIPRPLGFGRRLYAHDIRVMDHATVLAHRTAAEQRISVAISFRATTVSAFRAGLLDGL
jgi:hypothetical protein